VTVNDALALPLGPVQSRPKVLLPVNAPVDWVPEVALAPDHAPVAEQEVTFAEDQMSIEGAPLVTSEGIAASDTVGTDDPGTVTVADADALALPPESVQVIV
jgi:hypothetical protein